MSDSPILAVIPFYRRQDQLDRCLAALAKGTVRPEPFIHDNSTENLGFTRACNLGLATALRRGHAYVLLLNQDCYVEPTAVAEMIAFMDAHPRCAIAGVKQLSAERPDEIVHGGCTDAYPEGRHIIGRVSAGDCAISGPAPWVNGACWIVRLAAVAEIGLMDEAFFLVCSDADYCFTAHEKGWEVWYCAEAVVRHETDGVSGGGAAALDHVARLQADQRRFRDKWVGDVADRLRGIDPGTDHLAEARRAYAQGDILEAEIQSRQALASAPDDAQAALILGLALLRSGWAALAAQGLKALTARFPAAGPVHAALADALNAAGVEAEAVDHYARAVELGVGSAELHNNWGVALQRLGRIDAAKAQWRRVLEIDPANAFARARLAEAGET